MWVTVPIRATDYTPSECNGRRTYVIDGKEYSDCSFCGSPCPAEAFGMNGGMDKIGAFCDFYKEQVNYALRLIADGKADDYLWDGWDEGTDTVFAMS